MKYRSLKKNTFTNNVYQIVPIRMKDREKIRKWRNAQIDILRQKTKLTKKEQQQYFDKIVRPLFYELYPSQLLFSFFKGSLMIGYGGLVNVSWLDKRAEMSFLLDNNRVENDLVYEEDMINFIILIKQVCFTEMEFNRLFTETYSFRNFHISILEKAGFKKEGKMRQHIFYQSKYYDSILHSILKNEYYEK